MHTRALSHSVVWCLLALPLCAAPAVAQDAGGTSTASSPGDGFWARWFTRSDQAKSEQPHWITPLATTTPRLEQEFRYDVLWTQPKVGGPYTENVGNSKGLELIPVDNVEVIVSVPPYVVHHNPNVADGFGDSRLLVKYRLLSADEQHGNYIVTAFLDASFPTGSGTNGQTNAIVTPTISYGKGIQHVAVQGTFGFAEPTGNEAVIGRTYTWNNAFQYHVMPRVWPEVEVNASFFQDGKNAGKKQVFITPGVVFGRIPLNDRLGLTIGAGVQLPVTTFRTSTHNVILSVRLPF